MVSHISKSEKKILKKIKEDYSRGRCVQIWNDVKSGLRKRFPRYFWEKHSHLQYLTEEFIKEFQKELKTKQYPNTRDFRKYKLRGLIGAFENSTYITLTSTGFTDSFSDNYDPVLVESPWSVLDSVTRNYWTKKENRIKATTWLVEKLNKPITDIMYTDFIDNDIATLIKHYTKDVYKALNEAGYDVLPWEMKGTAHDFFDKKKNRLKATKWLVKKLSKPLKNITQNDFRSKGLRSLIERHGCSPYKTLKEAYPQLEERGMHKKPHGYWKRNFEKELLAEIIMHDGMPTHTQLENEGKHSLKCMINQNGGYIKCGKKYVPIAMATLERLTE
jgi:hypothetical protein